MLHNVSIIVFDRLTGSQCCVKSTRVINRLTCQLRQRVVVTHHRWNHNISQCVNNRVSNDFRRALYKCIWCHLAPPLDTLSAWHTQCLYSQQYTPKADGYFFFVLDSCTGLTKFIVLSMYKICVICDLLTRDIYYMFILIKNRRQNEKKYISLHWKILREANYLHCGIVKMKMHCYCVFVYCGKLFTVLSISQEII